MSMFKMASALARRRTVRPCAPTLARFAQEVRPAVARVAERDERLRDLAASFPALLHRLAVEPNAARSARAVEIVRAGGSLKAAASVAGTPFWTRRLPPEAFGETSPELPGGAIFSIRVANALPRSPSVSAAWLSAVAEAARWGEDADAIWAARESADPEGLTPEEARLVALHAWYARRPDVQGGALAGGRWSTAVRRQAALERARTWLERIEAYLALGDESVDPWLETGAVDGFDFVALADREALEAEGQAMRNCVRTYACYVARDYERLFSVRREGRRVATLSVRFIDEAPFPQIDELKGPENAAAPPEVWFAARRWISVQSPPRPEAKPWSVPIDDRARWSALWTPWWLARRSLPLELPLRPNDEALRALYAFRPHRKQRRRRQRRQRA